MVSSPISAVSVLAASRAARLSKGLTFTLLASTVMSFLAGSSAPTPLYALYQARWGFSPITTTVIFGVYALAVLAALVTVGSLSDYVGRRPVLVAATLLQALTMLLFATASGVSTLLVARVVQGIATGGALGAIGAGLVDIDRMKGTVANSVAPMLGTATGGVVSGLMVQYLPAPTQLVYFTLLLVFLVQAVGVVLMAETAQVRPGALASLRPQFRLPAELRAPMLVAAPLLVAAWALPGFYGSLGPLLIQRVVGHKSVLLGGLALFVLAGSGAAAVLLLRARAARFLTLVGAFSLGFGVSLTLWAIARNSVPVLFVGMAVAGAGFGTGFQGAIRNLIPNAPAHARAGVLSVIFLISYLAMGAPAIAAGFRFVHTRNLPLVANEYGVSVIVLAAAAFVGALRRPYKAGV